MQILCIGEILWDVIDSREFLGGAPLNFAVSARRLGNLVAVLSSVGDDPRGHRALEAMRHQGIPTDFVQTTPAAPTGAALVSTDRDGNATFVIDRPAAFDVMDLGPAQIAAIQGIWPQWIYFGTLAQAFDGAEQRLTQILKAVPHARRFYDINLRTGHWALPLVERLSSLATIIKMNESESEVLWRLSKQAGQYSIENFCRYWASAHHCEIICITRGSEGCAVWQNGALSFFPGIRVTVVDTVGAGDAFAAAFLHGIESEWPIDKTAHFANCIGGFVASQAGATPEWTLEQFSDLVTLPE